MRIFSTKADLRSELNLVKSSGKTIGLVPTMGALHDGHMKLVEECLNLCEICVVSIFVNPTQFNNASDLEKYPRNLAQDIKLLETHSCDYLFTPSVSEMYSSKSNIKIHFGLIEQMLEGSFRPGHFNGVGLVVSKLFNIVQPTFAFFGQKDLQQFFIVKSLIDELHFPLNLIRVSTVREDSGLAMSSRNERLSPVQRRKASMIYQTLKRAKQEILDKKPLPEVKSEVITEFRKLEGMELEYFEIVETNQFTSISNLNYEEIALCIAVQVGEVRLIDNLLLFS